VSTKVSWLYGIPEKHGLENDYHLYFDYADFSVHLEINGKEVPLPPKLRRELKDLYDFFSDALYIIAKAYVLAKKYGKFEVAESVVNDDVLIVPKDEKERDDDREIKWRDDILKAYRRLTSAVHLVTDEKIKERLSRVYRGLAEVVLDIYKLEGGEKDGSR